MFAYKDPTGSNFLESQNALETYRATIHSFYRPFALESDSAFTLLDAFSELTPVTQPTVSTVPWFAFPKTAVGTFDDIDANRFQLQDEYVEWRTEKSNTGEVTRVTFTTEFPEYYEALAEVSAEALIAGIQQVISGADPTAEELFGPSFDPKAATPEGRARRFRGHLRDNPWNNGQKGILCLSQPNNSMGALFALVGPCAVSRLDIDPSDLCANVSCVPERNSDPAICQAVQNLARAPRSLSFPDPVGIKIIELKGIWNINGTRIKVNDPSANQRVWVVSRNGRRAVLDVTKGVTVDGKPISSGTQVSTQLQVGADVISAAENVLPEWAKTGQESSRVLAQK